MENFAGVPVLVEEAPEFEIRGGLFYLTIRIGGEKVVRVMRPNTFMEAFRRFAETAQEWRVEQSGKVERIDHWRGHPDHQAASS